MCSMSFCRCWMTGGSQIPRDARWISRIRSWSWHPISARSICWTASTAMAGSNSQRRTGFWENSGRISDRSFWTVWTKRSCSNRSRRTISAALSAWSLPTSTDGLRTGSCVSRSPSGRGISSPRTATILCTAQDRSSDIYRSTWRHSQPDWSSPTRWGQAMWYGSTSTEQRPNWWLTPKEDDPHFPARLAAASALSV